ncbi:MAG TPA: hypothetical protein VF444_09030 [Pseudonocardiaceae bacterium]
MADGFSVDLGALEDAAAGVNKTLSDLKAHKVSDLGGSKDDYGHDDLAGTAAGFCGRWERGVENLAKDGQEVASRLSMSVQAYMRVDQAAKGMFDGILARGSGDDPGVQ